MIILIISYNNYLLDLAAHGGHADALGALDEALHVQVVDVVLFFLLIRTLLDELHAASAAGEELVHEETSRRSEWELERGKIPPDLDNIERSSRWRAQPMLLKVGKLVGNLGFVANGADIEMEKI